MSCSNLESPSRVLSVTSAGGGAIVSAGAVGTSALGGARTGFVAMVVTTIEGGLGTCAAPEDYLGFNCGPRGRRRLRMDWRFRLRLWLLRCGARRKPRSHVSDCRPKVLSILLLPLNLIHHVTVTICVGSNTGGVTERSTSRLSTPSTRKRTK